MTISELIAQLEAIKAEHGDLPAYFAFDCMRVSIKHLDAEPVQGFVIGEHLAVVLS